MDHPVFLLLIFFHLKKKMVGDDVMLLWTIWSIHEHHLKRGSVTYLSMQESLVPSFEANDKSSRNFILSIASKDRTKMKGVTNATFTSLPTYYDLELN